MSDEMMLLASQMVRRKNGIRGTKVMAAFASRVHSSCAVMVVVYIVLARLPLDRSPSFPSFVLDRAISFCLLHQPPIFCLYTKAARLFTHAMHKAHVPFRPP
jgi:hypothetical protein